MKRGINQLCSRIMRRRLVRAAARSSSSSVTRCWSSVFFRRRLSFRRGQPQVLRGPLVDVVDEAVDAELFDLLPEMNAGLLPQLVVAAVLNAGLRYEGGEPCGCGKEPKFRLASEPSCGHVESQQPEPARRSPRY
ncbi:hypothetical protein ACFYWN_45930 [Streptomyces sp. NPDC002917]|uniref:hypothetical protein n=1 Tax=Streptomyces sp. NPDC002917 TaxID=3364671 RepID=UPI00368A299E